MRQLHFVERDAATGHVVLATSDGLERFEVAIEQKLRDVVQQASSRPSPVHAAPGSRAASAEARISPREIQMRVRAGDSAEALADEHGAALDWVMRFAAPVLTERTRMSVEARRAKARRSTTEGQTVVFGEAVDERFAAHGIDPLAVRWDAHRREDAQWIVSAHWIGGQSQRTAEWAFHLSARTVAPADDTAADLLSDRPIRAVVAAPDPDVPPNLSLAPPLEAGVVASAAMSDAHTGPLPRAEEVFDQEQFQERVRERFTGRSDEPASQPPVPAAPHDLFNAPPLPLHVPDSPAATRVPKINNLGVAGRDESDEHKVTRPSVPSWDDILLGVRRKQD